jgi:hypothetical protein
MQSEYLFDTHIDQLPRFLSDKDIAKHTPFGRSTLQHWRLAGKGPKAVTISGRVFYRREDVISFFHGQELAG